jgi:mannose-1-phosphate guanylyltransferase / mannose-6-phosphate isomerase
MIVPVILSGGVGSRLWPLSREFFPKQLMPIMGGEFSLFQKTLLRIAEIPEMAPPIVICNESHRFMIAAQIQSIDMSQSAIILEPVGRNTCPAITVAALEASKDGSDPVLLIIPADHLIDNGELFASAVQAGKDLASEGSIITFGIVPDRPETGYGYIKRGQCVAGSPPDADLENRAFAVCEFTEKPEYEKACSYVASKEYFWNSGMFMFQPSVYLQELAAFSPQILTVCREAYDKSRRDLDFIRLEEKSFSSCPNISVDYAVLEKTSRAAVIPVDVGWSDVGSWLSLHDACCKDENRNVVNGDVILEDVRNCYIHSEDRLIAALGIENQIIVETKDAILVSAIDRSQDVKLIVNRLKKEMRDEAVTHSRTYRPWGSYENIDTGDRFKVKRITVNPGASLSLQMHYHRAEHWIVVRGTARIVKGEEVFLLNEDQSTYIPWGTQHRLENPGKIPLELVEVQSGSYLGEDDICRFDDIYGRLEH